MTQRGVGRPLFFSYPGSMKKTALLDVDGPLADFCGGVYDLVQQVAGVTLVDQDFPSDWNFLDRIEEAIRKKGGGLPYMAKAQVIAGISEKGFCENLRTVPGAAEAVESLRKNYDVMFVTSPWHNIPFWMYERTRWLVKNMGARPKDIIHCSQKHLVRGTFLLDDSPEHVRSWAQVQGETMPSVTPAWLWSTYFNQEERDLRRLRSWEEVLELAGV